MGGLARLGQCLVDPLSAGDPRLNPSDIQSKLSSSRTEGGTKVSRESVPGSASTIWYAQRDALRPGPAEEIAGGWSETARSRVAEFLERIETKTLTVGVVGLGYVGLPIVREFNERGFPVIGFDVDSTKIEKLKAGEAYLRHIGEDLPRKLAASENFRPTDDPVLLREADAILLCVPTPLGKHREPDLSYVRSSTEMVAKILRPGQLIILESTTYPQTTRETIPPILETTGLTSGEDFFVAYSPEREDPGRSDHSTHTIPKLVGGLDSASTTIASALYRAVIEKVHTVSSAEVAESAKLLENIYRAVNIALVNELKVVLSDMDIDIWEVIEAAATKPFGFQAFYPGPGLGGHCIPIDPYYLTWKAKEYGHSTRFIELAGEINTQMPSYVVESTARRSTKPGSHSTGRAF